MRRLQAPPGAIFRCTDRDAQATECARDLEEATARANLQTQLLVVPALRLLVVDEKDPVKVGDTTTYLITVLNQGTGPDQNVTIKAKLPDQEEFVKASGTTKAKSEGQTVTFEPVKELQPGEKAEWTLQVKAKQEGDVRTRVELSSDYLSSPVPDVEPTRLIK